MPAIGRVLENEVQDDLSIKSKVSITAAHSLRAEYGAKNTALLYNGYSKAFTRKGEGPVSIEVEEIRRVTDNPIRNEYLATTVISGDTRDIF